MATLVMTVGTGRDRKDIAEALLFSVKRHNPDEVILLCSRTTAQQTLPLLEEGLQQMGCKYRAHTLDNENNVQSLYCDYLEILRKFGRRGDITVDFTSGTKAMSSALFASAVAVQAGKISYITGPRDKTGRVTKSTDVEAFYPAQVYAHQQMNSAMLLFNHMEFEAVKQLAGQLRDNDKLSGDIRLWAGELDTLADGYDNWERFRWQRAACCLGKSAKCKSALKQFIDVGHIRQAGLFCDTVQKNQWSLERLYDLAANARRRFEQGRYDDALSRLYRAYEYMAQVRLKTEYDILTNKVGKSQLTGLNVAAEFVDKLRFSYRGKNQNPTVKMGLRDDLELLCRIGDNWGKALQPLYFGDGGFDRQNGPLARALDRRNQSWLAHGTKPAEEKDVKYMLENLFELLENFLPKEQLQRFSKVTQFPQMPLPDGTLVESM